ncbi:hypothetical protein M9435_005570 [Picochlorum sp. BPE23]|nr:hypothetical protein M9435_005570 [Picochlorum sp. BPE23]
MGRSRSRSRSRERRYNPDGGRYGRSRDRYDDGRSDELVMQVQKQQQAARLESWQNPHGMPNWTQTSGSLNPNVGNVAGILETPAQQQERKQREIYVGNLAVGVVTKEVVEEFFNQALSHLVADPILTPPVVSVKMEGSGRFAFVELRTRDISDQAMLMDKIVEIYGRYINVGRPKGYIENYVPPVDVEDSGPKIPTEIKPAEPTEYLLLSNILPAKELKSEEMRDNLVSAVKDEASEHGKVNSVAVPPPPESWDDRGPGRAYIKYKSKKDAIEGHRVFHTRTLNDSSIYARYVSENEFEQAAQGTWVDRTKPNNGLDLPGLYTTARYASGVSGLAVISPTLAPLMQGLPAAKEVLASVILDEEVPFEEGWIKIRGFAQNVSKDDIAAIFKDAGTVSHDDIKLVHSADGTNLGEAYIHIHGPDAKLRLALAKDGRRIAEHKITLEVFTAFEADVERRIFSGCQMR